MCAGEGEGEEWNTFRVEHILLVSFVAVDKNGTNYSILTPTHAQL
jgi:hypothetical protein